MLNHSGITFVHWNDFNNGGCWHSLWTERLMYKTMRVQRKSHSAKYFSEVYFCKSSEPLNDRNQKLTFAPKNTSLKLPSKSSTTFRKHSRFLTKSYCLHGSLFEAKYNKKRKSSVKRFSISYQIKKEKETWTNFLPWKQSVPAVMNHQSSDSGLIESSL